MFPGLNDSEAKALVDAARAIGTDPQYLWELINFESGHDPKKKNPKSSARGLVQFMDDTAIAMGFPGGSAELVGKYPTYEAQMMGPVVQYFTRLPPVSSTYSTRQALYMKVFMPVAMYLPPNTTYVDTLRRAKWSDAKIAKFTATNPGIKTIADYVNNTLKSALRPAPRLIVKGMVNTVTHLPPSEKSLGGGAVVLLLAAVFWFIRR